MHFPFVELIYTYIHTYIHTLLTYIHTYCTSVVHNLFRPGATKRSIKPFGGQTGVPT